MPRVVLAVDEALTNIIRHAYLVMRNGPSSLFRRIHVSHEGKPEMPSKLYWKIAERRESREMCGRALEDVRPGALGYIHT